MNKHKCDFIFVELKKNNNGYLYEVKKCYICESIKEFSGTDIVPEENADIWP